MIRPIRLSSILCLALSALVTATPVEMHGALSVADGQVVDRNGAPPQLRGMSFYWSQAKVGKDFYNAGVVNWLASDWNANIVRAAMAIEGDWSTVEKGYLSDPSGNKARVKAVVDAAIAKGIYVIIDWHDHNALDHKEQAKAFFKEMSETYGKSPNVIFEIFNEPLDVSWTSLKTYATDLLAVIRPNSENLVIVGTGKWDTELIPPSKDPITNYRNVAYAFHMYASEEWHHTHYMKRADSAIAAKLPLFVSEWGLSPASGNGSLNMTWVNDFWNWMEKNKLSSCAWSLSDASESSAALKAVSWNGDGSAKHNVSTTGNWSASDLTEGGTWLRTKFKTSNPVSISGSARPGQQRLRRTGNGLVDLPLPEGARSVQVFAPTGSVIQSVSVTGLRGVELDLPRGLHLVRVDDTPVQRVLVP